MSVEIENINLLKAVEGLMSGLYSSVSSFDQYGNETKVIAESSGLFQEEVINGEVVTEPFVINYDNYNEKWKGEFYDHTRPFDLVTARYQTKDINGIKDGVINKENISTSDMISHLMGINNHHSTLSIVAYEGNKVYVCRGSIQEFE